MIDIDLDMPSRFIDVGCYSSENDCDLSDVGCIYHVTTPRGTTSQRKREVYKMVKREDPIHTYNLPKSVYYKKYYYPIYNLDKTLWYEIISYSPRMLGHRNMYRIVMRREDILIHDVKFLGHLAYDMFISTWITRYGTFIQELN